MPQPRPPARVLFLCTGNACRSQMAEGWARRLLAETVEPCSAGTAPAGVDPRAVLVMSEVGVDIASQRSKHLREIDVGSLDWVVTVCDRAATNCPVPPPGVRRLHAPFDDPPAIAPDGESLDSYRRVRDEIRRFVASLPERLSLRIAPDRGSMADGG